MKETLPGNFLKKSKDGHENETHKTDEEDEAPAQEQVEIGQSRRKERGDAVVVKEKGWKEIRKIPRAI